MTVDLFLAPAFGAGKKQGNELLTRIFALNTRVHAHVTLTGLPPPTMLAPANA